MKAKKARKNNMISAVASVAVIGAVAAAGITIYSCSKDTLSLCKFANGITHQNIAAVIKSGTDETAYAMSPEESERFYGQWEKSFTLENEITLPSDFDENSYNVGTEIYNLMDSDEAKIWLNQHKYDHESETFDSLSYDEAVNDTYSDELKLKEILKENNFSDTIYTTDSLDFENVTVNGQDFGYFCIIDQKISDIFNFKSTAGKNLSETESENDNIEAVAIGADETLLNSEFDVRLYNYKKNTYDTKTVKIVGITDTPYYKLNHTSYLQETDDYRLDDFIEENSSYTKPELLIKSFDGYEKYIYHASETSGYYYLDLSDTNVNELKTVLSNNGYEVIELKEVYNSSYTEALKEVFSGRAGIIVSVVLILIILAILAIVLSNKKSVPAIKKKALL